MRVLTFQSDNVLRAILKDGFYLAQLDLCREKNNYSEDIKRLSGSVPIWCFTPVDKDGFTATDFINGRLLNLFGCEMSLQEDDALSSFTLLELEVPIEDIYIGTTRNAYSGAKIIATISRHSLCAVYHLSYENHWFYPLVSVVSKYREDVLFQEDTQCKKIRIQVT